MIGRGRVVNEQAYDDRVKRAASLLTPSEAETLTCLVEEGPLDIGSSPDREMTKSLCLQELLVMVAVKGQAGLFAAGVFGIDVYCAYYGNADDIQEAMAYRKTQEAIAKAQR